MMGKSLGRFQADKAGADDDDTARPSGGMRRFRSLNRRPPNRFRIVKGHECIHVRFARQTLDRGNERDAACCQQAFSVPNDIAVGQRDLVRGRIEPNDLVVRAQKRLYALLFVEIRIFEANAVFGSFTFDEV